MENHLLKTSIASSPDALRQALAERGTPIFWKGAPVSGRPGVQGAWLAELAQIVAAVDRIGRTRSTLYQTAKSARGLAPRATDLGRVVMELLGLPIQAVRESLRLYHLDPRVDLFMDEALRRGLTRVGVASPWTNEPELIATVDAANGFISAIRSRCAQRSFENKIAAHVKSSYRAYSGLRGYLGQLLLLHPRLLPVTLELSYQHGAPLGASGPESALKILGQHTAQLVDRITTVFGNAVVGYAWHQEAIFGHVSHLLLLVDGVSSEETFALPATVGQTWIDEVTSGAGCYYSGLTTADPRFHFRGLSPDDRRYLPLSQQLDHMAIYMRLVDRVIALNAPARASIRSMGAQPKPPASMRPQLKRPQVPSPDTGTSYPFPQLSDRSAPAGLPGAAWS